MYKFSNRLIYFYILFAVVVVQLNSDTAAANSCRSVVVYVEASGRTYLKMEALADSIYRKLTSMPGEVSCTFKSVFNKGRLGVVKTYGYGSVDGRCVQVSDISRRDIVETLHTIGGARGGDEGIHTYRALLENLEGETDTTYVYYSFRCPVVDEEKFNKELTGNEKSLQHRAQAVVAAGHVRFMGFGLHRLGKTERSLLDRIFNGSAHVAVARLEPVQPKEPEPRAAMQKAEVETPVPEKAQLPSDSTSVAMATSGRSGKPHAEVSREGKPDFSSQSDKPSPPASLKETAPSSPQQIGDTQQVGGSATDQQQEKKEPEGQLHVADGDVGGEPGDGEMGVLNGLAEKIKLPPGCVPLVIHIKDEEKKDGSNFNYKAYFCQDKNIHLLAIAKEGISRNYNIASVVYIESERFLYSENEDRPHLCSSDALPTAFAYEYLRIEDARKQCDKEHMSGYMYNPVITFALRK
ncbi:hypothetical protein [Maridesulfovibrio sp.]|uniref:hypothetical protein n=1 Tax=Maridesulfovibrio sp. TaxID=2795000 RepID=UPI002A18C4F4|nr:hypothetical protein [Maridesulfovibrio sp.]